MGSLFYVCSLLDSTHGGSYGKHEGMMPLDQQHQFFGELNFPVPDSEAWKEKVNFTGTHYDGILMRATEYLSSVYKLGEPLMNVH